MKPTPSNIPFWGPKSGPQIFKYLLVPLNDSIALVFIFVRELVFKNQTCIDHSNLVAIAAHKLANISNLCNRIYQMYNDIFLFLSLSLSLYTCIYTQIFTIEICMHIYIYIYVYIYSHREHLALFLEPEATYGHLGSIGCVILVCFGTLGKLLHKFSRA